MELRAYLRELGLSLDEDYMREALSVMMRLLMEIEVSRSIEASPYERTSSRAAYRNGYRQRSWRTRFGDVTLHIPKLRRGSYYPDFIRPGIEPALLALLQETYIRGADYADIASLLDELDIPEAHPSEVAAIVETLDQIATRFRERPLEVAYPYIWLDVIEAHVREDRRFVAVAVGMRGKGDYDVLGFEVGTNVDDPAFWQMFLSSLVARGLDGVQLVMSDAYSGIKRAVNEVLSGAAWQYSRAQAIEEVLRYVPLDDQTIVAAAISTVFVQADLQAATHQLQYVIGVLDAHWPQSASYLGGMGKDMLAYVAFPSDDWMMIATTNVMARVKQAIAHQADAVGIFPNTEALTQWVSPDLVAIQREWHTLQQPVIAGLPTLA